MHQKLYKLYDTYENISELLYVSVKTKNIILIAKRMCRIQNPVAFDENLLTKILIRTIKCIQKIM